RKDGVAGTGAGGCRGVQEFSLSDFQKNLPEYRITSGIRPENCPYQGRNPLGLRFLRRFRLARTVEGDRLANEHLEGGLVNFFSFGDVDRAACVSVETRVEETGRILQRRARRATKSECPSTSSPRPRLGL